MQQYLLAIDQGTTNSRAIIFDKLGNVIAQHEIALNQFFPEDGWVEQDPLEMLNNTIECCRQVLNKSGLSAKNITAAGITNQRETTIIWEKTTGKPIYPAIVWQDRRTSEICKQLAQTKLSQEIPTKTGLLIDPYFSATKIQWILTHVPQARKRAECNELLFGTVDTFLLWHLTRGKSHKTDITNASRTMLFNIHTLQWDQDILTTLQIPENLLPEVHNNTADFGEIDASFFGDKISITGMAGDQQAAAFGQACFAPGMVKATYGTGCFVLLNTGHAVVQSSNQLLSTIAYRIDNKIMYGLEGCIFSAGVTIKWLREKLRVIKTAAETETLAQQVVSTGGVYLVPAFTGLAAPYWKPEARAALLGLTRNSGIEHIVRAALESVGYQTRDLLQAMIQDKVPALKTLRVDGGMAVNNWLMQFICSILNLEVHRPICIETTALGAAYFAGLQAGVYQSLEEINELWQMQTKFSPKMTESEREMLYSGWKNAINQVIQ